MSCYVLNINEKKEKKYQKIKDSPSDIKNNLG